MARKQAVYTQQRCSAEMLGRDACFRCQYFQTFVADLAAVEAADIEASPDMYSEMRLSVQRPFSTQTHGQQPSRKCPLAPCEPFAGRPLVGSIGAEVLWLPQPPEVREALTLSLSTCRGDTWLGCTPRFSFVDFLDLTLSYRRQKRVAVRQTSHTSCFQATLASSAQITILRIRIQVVERKHR